MDLIKTIQAETVQIREEKIKKKARRWAILALLLLLIIFLLPWVSDKVHVDPYFEQVVQIEFDKDFREASSTQKSSARAAAATEEAPTEDPEPVEEEMVEEVEPEPVPETKPEPKPEPKTEKVKVTPTPQKPVLTSDESTRKIDRKIEKMLEEVSEKAKVKEVSSQITEVTEEVTDDFMSDLADYFKKRKSKKKKPGGGAKSDKPDTGNSSTSGEGDSGSSDTGDSDTDGQGDEGDSGNALGDFDGDGLLTRKVIYRANLDNIIKQTGKITINLCVNRDGQVIYAEADRARSTIRNRDILKKAVAAAKKYRYEKDYTVAERQCGKLSFVVKIQK